MTIDRSGHRMTTIDLPDDEPYYRNLVDHHAERILVWVGPRATGCFIDADAFAARRLLNGGCDRACMIERCEYDETKRHLLIYPPEAKP